MRSNAEEKNQPMISHNRTLLYENGLHKCQVLLPNPAHSYLTIVGVLKCACVQTFRSLNEQPDTNRKSGCTIYPSQIILQYIVIQQIHQHICV